MYVCMYFNSVCVCVCVCGEQQFSLCICEERCLVRACVCVWVCVFGFPSSSRRSAGVQKLVQMGC